MTSKDVIPQYLVVTGKTITVHESLGKSEINMDDVAASTEVLQAADAVFVMAVIPGREVQIYSLKERLNIFPRIYPIGERKDVP